jgi:hypothetical protein
MTLLRKPPSGRKFKMPGIIIAFGLASLATFVSAQPALADCRSEYAACVTGARSPFDSVACGSLYRSCAAHQAQAAQQQPGHKRNAPRPTLQSAPRPASDGRR